MPVFKWKGRNRYGDVVRGERRAKNARELSMVLQQEQINVTNVARKGMDLKIPALERKKVKPRELAVFSRQLSVLIDAELPLIQGLNILSEQTKNKYFKRVLIKAREDVEAGSTLNQALRKFPNVFNDLFCNLIASGEQSGSLDIMLRRLAEFLERIVKLRAQVRQAMIYPSVIVVFAILVVIFMLWQVIPVFASVFIELGAQLPALTAFILTLSNFVQKYIIWIFAGIVALAIAFRFFRKSDYGRKVTDRIALKLPLFGALLKKVGLSRITRTLSTLLTGGVPMLESLKITSTTAGNVILEQDLMDVRSMVAEGSSMTDALKERPNFPFMMVQMVGVGEATGTLDEMLSKLADFYDEEVEATVSALLSVLEPVLLVFVGGMVGTIIVAMYLPIFSLISQF